MMNLQDITKKLSDATTALAKADNDLKLEIAGAAADAAGLIDPTPASDIVGAGISIARGDYWGAALSTVSMVPYLGDALAKPAKAVRATKAIMGLEKKIASLTQTVADLTKAKKEIEAAEVAGKDAKIAKDAESAKSAAAQQSKASSKTGQDCESCKQPSKPPARLMTKKRTPCFSAKKLDPKKGGEFAQQLKGQQDALNNLSVQEYLDARKYFKKHGRSGDGASQRAARKEYRNILEEDLREQYLDAGHSLKQAEAMAEASAKKTMSTLAALHEPDMIAGGKDVIKKLGDKSVNSSIGSQWKSRVETLDKAAQRVLKEDRGSTMMNVELPKCP